MESRRRERLRLQDRAMLLAVLCALLGVSSTRAAPSHHASAHASVPAQPARSAAAGGWSASGCGREPVAPTVETNSIARYNASIDAVTAYDQAARAYNACVSRTATAEETAISADAKRRIDAIQAVSESVQRRIAANFTALGAALKKGPPAR